MIFTDEESVILSRKEFDELPEYSCSLPSGVIPGKMWKRGEPYRGPRLHWLLGKYEPISGNQCRIEFRDIIVVEDP